MHPPIHQHITFLRVRDLAASAAFYEGALGLPLALDQGACRIYRLTDSAFLGICRREDAAAPDPAGVIVTLVTPDVEQWVARLQAAGIAAEAAPAHNPVYRITHFFVRDPDGFRLEIQRFDHPFP